MERADETPPFIQQNREGLKCDPKASSYSEERNSFQGVATKVSVDACP